MEWYLKSKNLVFREMVVLDNAPDHSQNTTLFICPSIEVVFASLNTISSQILPPIYVSREYKNLRTVIPDLLLIT